MINAKSSAHMKSLASISSVSLAALVVACSHAGGQMNGESAAASATPANCTPLETRAPNAANQRPAFPGQTRACGITSSAAYDVVVITKSLQKPWSVEPLPDGNLLVTEKAGRMRIVSASGQVSEPISGVPAVDARGQGGLLDVALGPTFDRDRTIYWTYTEAREGGNGTSIARGVLSPDRRSLSDVKVIFRVLPAYNGQQHFGSRIAFGPDGKLYASFGERSVTAMRPYAQRLDSHLGKTIRINLDGSAPSDNPFVGQADAKPEIWALGHRNPEALTFDGRGQLWDVEHGTRGGDELNLIQKGKNYGWPLQAYGEEYSGVEPISSAIGSASTTRGEMEQPVYYWDPVIAPSGSQFYSGDAFPAWRGNLFVGALKEMRLVRLVINNANRVVGEEHLLVGRSQRVRDVRQGPDGFLYVVTDQDAGELWKIVPKK
jgi:aldose sugar dehydrogenase